MHAGRRGGDLQGLPGAGDLPAVACVLTGARSLEELEECLDYGAPGSAGSDYTEVLAAFPRISWKGHCMYCGHCAPCTEHIDIARVASFSASPRHKTRCTKPCARITAHWR